MQSLGRIVVALFLLSAPACFESHEQIACDEATPCLGPYLVCGSAGVCEAVPRSVGGVVPGQDGVPRAGASPVAGAGAGGAGGIGASGGANATDAGGTGAGGDFGGGGGVRGGCGDGLCAALDFEDCKTCSVDCGGCGDEWCGDFVCSGPEDCWLCPDDCGKCEPTGAVCGDGVCVPELMEACGTCPVDCGTCGNPGAVCGDGRCGAGEDCWSCPTDCGSCRGVCGNFVCEPEVMESCEWCQNDCGVCAVKCEHDLCTVGGPLAPECDKCATVVCEIDRFCCGAAWDELCVARARLTCGACP